MIEMPSDIKGLSMDLFPNIKQAVPLPHEKVLRYIVRKIRNNYSEKWLADTCRNNHLYDVYLECIQRGILTSLEGNPEFSYYPPRLTIELVPRSCWFDNVRSAVSSSDWAKLRKNTAKNAGWRCQICGGKGPQWPVECHEIWHYDDSNQQQTLVGLTSLCPSCHEVKHMGFSELRGKKEEAIAHLALVNGWSLNGAFDYVDEAFALWRKRSEHAWQLDISWLATQGISLKTEAKKESDNDARADQLTLNLDLSPVETEENVSTDERDASSAAIVLQEHNDAAVTHSLSGWRSHWKACHLFLTKIKKIMQEQW